MPCIFDVYPGGDALLQRANLLQPRLVVVGTTATPLFAGEQRVDLFWLLVQVRTLGAAAWVRLGTSVDQLSEFRTAGDFQIFDVPPGWIFDAASVFAAANVAGQVVLEITGAGPGMQRAVN